jgi:hypothetical protein
MMYDERERVYLSKRERDSGFPRIGEREEEQMKRVGV